MGKTVTMPNGQDVEFPDNMSNADIESTIKTDPQFKSLLVPAGKESKKDPGILAGEPPPLDAPFEDVLFNRVGGALQNIKRGVIDPVVKSKELLLKGGLGAAGTVLAAPTGPAGMAAGGTGGVILGGQINDLIDAIIEGRGLTSDAGFVEDVKSQGKKILRPGQVDLPFLPPFAFPRGTAVEGFGAEIGGPLVSKVTGRLLRPGGEISDVAKTAIKEKLPLKASILSDTKLAKVGEFIADKTAGGSFVFTKRARKIKEGLKRIADDFIKNKSILTKNQTEGVKEIEKLIKGATENRFGIQNDKIGSPILNPDKLLASFSLAKRALKESLPANIFKNLEDFVDLVSLASDDIATSTLSKDKMFFRGAQVGLAGLQIATGNTIGLGLNLGTQGMGAIIARAMTKPTGTIKKWLTTGLGGKRILAPALADVRGRLAAIQTLKEDEQEAPAFTPGNINFQGAGGL